MRSRDREVMLKSSMLLCKRWLGVSAKSENAVRERDRAMQAELQCLVQNQLFAVKATEDERVQRCDTQNQCIEQLRNFITDVRAYIACQTDELASGDAKNHTLAKNAVACSQAEAHRDYQNIFDAL